MSSANSEVPKVMLTLAKPSSQQAIPKAFQANRKFSYLMTKAAAGLIEGTDTENVSESTRVSFLRRFGNWLQS